MPAVDAASRLLFEDPTWLYVALALLAGALGMAWRAWRRRALAAALVVPVLLAAGAFVVSESVVTDREQIVAACHAIAEDLQAGRSAVLAKHLDEGYRGFGGTKQQALRRCQEEIRSHKPRVISCRELEVERTGLRARLRATTLIVPGRSSVGIGRPVPVKWQVTWAKRPEGWRIIEAAPPKR